MGEEIEIIKDKIFKLLDKFKKRKYTYIDVHGKHEKILYIISERKMIVGKNTVVTIEETIDPDKIRESDDIEYLISILERIENVLSISEEK